MKAIKRGSLLFLIVVVRADLAFCCFAFVNLFFFDRLYLPVLLGFEVGEKSMQAEHLLF